MRQKKGRFVYLEISGYLPAQVNEEQADRRRLEDENGPLLDRADRQGDEDEDRAEPPEDDVLGQFNKGGQTYFFSKKVGLTPS